MNRINLMGRLTFEPELKTPQSGQPWMRLRLAVRRDAKDKDGNYPTDFIDCVAFGRNAENIGRFVGKGQRLLVHGRLQIREYTSQSGEEKVSTEVVILEMEFIDRKQTAAQGGDAASTSSGDSGGDGFTEVPDEALPF